MDPKKNTKRYEFNKAMERTDLNACSAIDQHWPTIFADICQGGEATSMPATPARLSAGTAASGRGAAGMQMIGKETDLRNGKTARLKAARLAQEAEAGAADPKLAPTD